MTAVVMKQKITELNNRKINNVYKEIPHQIQKVLDDRWVCSMK